MFSMAFPLVAPHLNATFTATWLKSGYFRDQSGTGDGHDVLLRLYNYFLHDEGLNRSVGVTEVRLFGRSELKRFPVWSLVLHAHAGYVSCASKSGLGSAVATKTPLEQLRLERSDFSYQSQQ